MISLKCCRACLLSPRYFNKAETALVTIQLKPDLHPSWLCTLSEASGFVLKDIEPAFPSRSNYLPSVLRDLYQANSGL